MNHVTAFSTAMLAALTAWLAYDTHRLVQVTATIPSLNDMLALFGSALWIRAMTLQARDALIELRADGQGRLEGF